VKGSLRLIRELLATAGVAIRTGSIARFIAQVNGDPRPHRTPKRPGRQCAADPRTVHLGTQLSLLLPHRFPYHRHGLKHPPIRRQPTRRRSVHASPADALPIRATSEHARLP
jgi:hypothetical protein